MTTIKAKKTRFEARLTKEQKQLFEKAALLGGFRNLTNFIISTVDQRAKEIIDEREQILTSKKDGEIFFDAITNPDKPNSALTEATKSYLSLLSQ